MKKLVLVLINTLMLGTLVTFAQNGNSENTTSKAYTIQVVKGPLKEDVKAYTISYNYSSDDISKAIAAKLKNEGLSSSKAKNKFTGYKGVKYNPLWNKLFDFYILVNGSAKSGTIYLVLSTGYDNYITETEYEETDAKVSAWLVSLEEDIKAYILSNQIKDQEKKVKSAEKDLKKAQSKRNSLENKIDLKEKEIRKLEAIRATPDNETPSATKTKLIEKEQKLLDKLNRTKQDYEVDLEQAKSNIKKLQSEFDNENKILENLKSKRK
ncbi:MAG: hypothetical protein MJ010_08350 [Paludibacteraceae bacterium]|nr:hypothetical protein [Paludibacteraceae bacterium]